MQYKLIVIQAFCIVFRILWYPVVNYCVLKIRRISLVNCSKQNRNAKFCYGGVAQGSISSRHRNVCLLQPVRAPSISQPAVRQLS
jgi:hypothetical protein